MKTIKTTIIVLVTIFFFISCAGDDDNIPTVQTPTVTYTETSIDAIFFEGGNSSAPTVNWNGNQGSFSLANTIIGLAINSTTGVLNWTKALPQGTHAIQVVATNSAGQISKNLTIDNRLQGVFLHRFKNTCSYELEFYKDGTLDVTYIESVDVIAMGSWVINGNEITADYTFSGNNDQRSVKGDLTHTLTEASLDGDWYNGFGAISGQEGGGINLSLIQLPVGDGVISQLDDGRYIIIFYGGCGAACCYNTLQEAHDSYPNNTLTFVP